MIAPLDVVQNVGQDVALEVIRAAARVHVLRPALALALVLVHIGILIVVRDHLVTLVTTGTTIILVMPDRLLPLTTALLHHQAAPDLVLPLAVGLVLHLGLRLVLLLVLSHRPRTTVGVQGLHLHHL